MYKTGDTFNSKKEGETEPDIAHKYDFNANGPPSFYEADVKKYMSKFDDVLRKRAEYK